MWWNDRLQRAGRNGWLESLLEPMIYWGEGGSFEGLRVRPYGGGVA